ncbi:MAG: hypothetical protein ACQEQP_06765 [Bacillota bacterium]
MKKRYKYLILFFIISLILIGGFSVYHYWYNINNPNEVQHLATQDWSYPTKLIDNLYSREYEIIENDEYIEVLWIDRGSNIDKIKVSLFNRSGELIEENTIFEEEAFRNINYHNIDNQKLIFYLSGSGRNMKLNKLSFNDSFELQSEETLIEDLDNAGGLSSDDNNSNILLSWHHKIDEINDSYQIGTIKYNIDDGIIDNNPELIVGEYDSRYPVSVINDNEFYIISNNMDDRGYYAGSSSNNNRYLLTFNIINNESFTLDDSIELERTQIRNRRDRPEYVIINEDLYIYWNYFDSEDRARTIYYSNINLNDYSIKDLKHITGFNNSDPNILNTQDKNYFSYIKEVEPGKGIKLIESNEPINKRIAGETLFPVHKFVSQPRLSVNTDDESLLSWFRIKGGQRALYYSSDTEEYNPAIPTVLGLTREEFDLNPLTIFLYYFLFPFLPMAFNLQFLVLPFLAAFALYYFINYFKNDLLINKRYFTFITSIIFIIIGAIIRGDLSFLFFPEGPPSRLLIPILISALISVIIYFNEVDELSGLEFYIGFSMVLALFYWIAQINLVFQTFNYFL